MKLTNEPEGRKVRRFVEGFLAEFVATGCEVLGASEEVERDLVCRGKAVLTYGD